MAIRMQQRRGTSADWTSFNPVLGAGEIGFETDTGNFKLGDGAANWADLDYFISSDEATLLVLDLLGDQTIDGTEGNTVKDRIESAIDDIIDASPETLDTLKELADAIGNDPDFAGTITGAISEKLSKSGGTMTGDLTLAQDPTSSLHAVTKQYVDSLETDQISEGQNSLYYTDERVSNVLEPRLEKIPTLFAQNETPAAGLGGINELSPEDLWYDSSNGHLYLYYNLSPEEYVWVQVGGTSDVYNNATQTHAHDFPVDPSNGDTHKGYIYDSSRSAWKIDNSISLDQIPEIETSNTAEDDILLYDQAESKWKNSPGIKLDAQGKIPLSFLTLLQQESENTFAKAVIKSDDDWDEDSSTPPAGSLNISLGDGVGLKIGNGQDSYANLEYVPTNNYIASEVGILTALINDRATIDSPTFSGTVLLPSTTSIGDVSDTEIGYLDGVTGGIQGQIDGLSSSKAPLESPTFTGTVSGITKSMVGLGDVDNTSDINKPVSTAQQSALDTKLSLSGGTMTGKIFLDGHPTQALHAVTKQYVDSVEAGLITRPAVRAATTSNLSGTYDNGNAGVGATLNLGQLSVLDIDGIDSWSQWDSVLVKNQANGFENGRYVISQIGNDTDTDWILRRCGLCDEAHEIPGSYLFVTEGTVNVQTGWVQHVSSPSTFTVGTDDINIYQFSGAGTVTAGTNISVVGGQVYVVDAPSFSGVVDVAAAGVLFSDGAQTKAGVPSQTSFSQKTESYTLDTLSHRDNVVEINSSSNTTFTIPTDSELEWPVGVSMDIIRAGTGEVEVVGSSGVVINATPGLLLRDQWSSATILKRSSNNWIVYGDLKI